MGYRSTVVVTTAPHIEVAPEIFAGFEIIAATAGTLICADYIKWQPECANVAAIEKWLQQIALEDFHFFRCGEDTGDLEDFGEFNVFEVGIESSVVWTMRGEYAQQQIERLHALNTIANSIDKLLPNHVSSRNEILDLVGELLETCAEFRKYPH